MEKLQIGKLSINLVEWWGHFHGWGRYVRGGAKAIMVKEISS